MSLFKAKGKELLHAIEQLEASIIQLFNKRSKDSNYHIKPLS